MTGVPGSLRWLVPGLRLKRWLACMIIGGLILVMGGALAMHGQSLDMLHLPNRAIRLIARRWPNIIEDEALATWLGAAASIAGAALIFHGGAMLSRSLGLIGSSNADSSGGAVNSFLRNRLLAQGPSIVVIGGGTGLSTMLRGLKNYSSNITAVVTVTDDGGSSGALQQQLNMPPPGDIRNCLVALADAETAMTDLFQYRFRGDNVAGGLRDHAFGNILIAAMMGVANDDFQAAVQFTSRVLKIRGTVLPSTLTQVRLRGEMDDGNTIMGETSIVHHPSRIRRVSLDPGDAAAPPEVVEAITAADIVVIGPGSVYTSVIPNLLVKGIPEALYRTRARRVYVCNVMTQPGESDGFTASDHLAAIETHVPRPIVDYVIINNAVPSLDVLNRYRQSGAILVEPDADRIRAKGYRPVLGTFMNQTDMVRHDPDRLAQAILRLFRP